MRLPQYTSINNTMTDKIFDWEGNEVKAGMTIYFVQTKPGFLESGRVGVTTPQTGEIVWEDESSGQERKNKVVWELGEEMLVEKDANSRLIVKTVTKGAGELEGYTFNSTIDLIMQKRFSPDLTIAIKGISDKQYNDR